MSCIRVRFAAVILGILALASCSRDPEVRKQRYLESGIQYFEQSKYEEALIEFRNAVQIDPRFGQARVRLAETYARLGNHAGALGEYVRAADVLGDDPDVRLKAGQYMLAAGRLEDALRYADEAIKLAPARVDAHILRGNALAGQKDFDSAIAEIEEAIRLDPDRGPSHANLGAVEFARGNDAEAEAAFKRAVSLAPQASGAHLALANFYWAIARLTDAEVAFHAAWKREPKIEATNRGMAAFLMSNGKAQHAEPYLVHLAETQGLSARLALSDYYLAIGRDREAVERLQKLLGESPKNSEVLERLARAFAVTGDRPRAHAIIDDLLRSDPGFARARLFKARLLADEGLGNEALRSARDVAEAEPNSIDAHFMLGGLYAAQGDVASAEKAYKEVLRLNPRAAAAQFRLARLQLRTNPSASLQTAEQAVRNLPQSTDARLALIRSLVATNDLARAEKESAALLKEYPNTVTVHVQSGVVAATRKDYSVARMRFEKALSLQPESIEALTGIVLVELTTKNFAAARTLIDRRLGTASPSAELHLLAGRTYAATGDMDRAEKHLRSAIEAKPALLPAYEALAKLYLSQRKLEQARQEFDRLAERQAQPVAALTMAAIILQAQGKEDEARRRYERALVSDPRAGIAANNLAWLHVESGKNLDVALQLAQTAVAVMPENPEVLDTLGWIYYRKNMPALAVPPLKRCVEMRPDNATYQFHLGAALVQSGNHAAGAQALTRALALNGKFPAAEEARQILGRLSR